MHEYYGDGVSATLHTTHCPTCGQECSTPILKGSLWHLLVTFTAAAVAKQPGSLDLPALFREQEKQLPKRVRAQINRRSTFRVQKHLLARCVKRGIPLLRPNGQPKGKTQLERELRV